MRRTLRARIGIASRWGLQSICGILFFLTLNLVQGCIPVDNQNLPLDPILLDLDGDGAPEQLPDGTAVDCDPQNSSVHPNAPELCDGLDNDCDAQTDEDFDLDGDGQLASGLCASGRDCDDENAAIKPGASEICDGVDNNCDGAADEGFDADKDGFTDCEEEALECDPYQSASSPNADEVCDGIDNDCDGRYDEGFLDPITSTPVCVDDDNDGWTEEEGDCNDGQPAVRPGAVEVCNSLDDNCDGTFNEGFDDDQDGVAVCQDDCDDHNVEVGAPAPEVCDSIDNNCDGSVDEGFDADGDGYTTCAGDCQDLDPSIHPAAPELCSNGTDDDCDGQKDEPSDADLDGYTTCSGSSTRDDCNDADASIHPGQQEVCDGIDNNCTAGTDESFDADGDGYIACQVGNSVADCDDQDPETNPEATEICSDGTDNNCSGKVDEIVDADGDGAATCEGIYSADCDDSNAAISPFEQEICDGLDTDCSGGSEDYYVSQGPAGDFYTIQTAIDAVASGCSIMVDAGIYSEDITFGGKSIALISQYGAEQTRIEGSGYGSTVFIAEGEGIKTQVKGFTISGGTGTSVVFIRPPGTYTFGGGIYISNGASPTIEDNVIEGNSAQFGGGIFSEEGSATIRNNIFRNNHASNLAGALYYLDGYEARIEGNRFEENVVDDEAIVFVRYTIMTTVAENVFTGNTAANGAGLESDNNVDALIQDNWFEGNIASISGGAMGLYSGDDVTVIDNIFLENVAGVEGGAIDVGCEDDGATRLIHHNYFGGNYAANGGGAVSVENCMVDLRHNVFTDNVAQQSEGGALFLQDAVVMASNNLLYGNRASVGGAVAVTGPASTSYFYNNTITDNVADNQGGGIYVATESPNFENNLITFNANTGFYALSQDATFFSSIRYNDIFGNTVQQSNITLIGTSNNISTDPMYLDRINGDYHLDQNSSVRNAGDPASSAKDPDGSRNDMGAYGGPGGSWSVLVP